MHVIEFQCIPDEIGRKDNLPEHSNGLESRCSVKVTEYIYRLSAAFISSFLVSATPDSDTSRLPPVRGFFEPANSSLLGGGGGSMQGSERPRLMGANLASSANTSLSLQPSSRETQFTEVAGGRRDHDVNKPLSDSQECDSAAPLTLRLQPAMLEKVLSSAFKPFRALYIIKPFWAAFGWVFKLLGSKPKYEQQLSKCHGGLCIVPVRLRAGAFDLCLTAGPVEDVSVGSCGRLISPPLTQAQLVDSTLWDSARKLSGPPSDKSPERIPRWLSQALAPVACFPLFAYSELQRGTAQATQYWDIQIKCCVKKGEQCPCHVKNADSLLRLFKTECLRYIRQGTLQQQDRGVKTTSLNVMVGAVTIVTESSARLGFGTELSAAVGLQVSNDGAT
ncbi:hypothetical protein D9C73_019962 [Collichthys lucidus]|uniref:Uncharacterized protein n=1 Tax=Collichthys lucidus TaxID=240159 RepID=A0A4U5VCT9_COLLU|nr:hypothetical protein D9C73_019962 [Collichthys lucidus]